MKASVRKMEEARRLAAKLGDLEKTREQERGDELRAIGRLEKPSAAKNPTDAELLADGCHPDSLNWDGADKGL